MKIVVAILAWVTINGFPIEPFETCELAQTRVQELRQKMPDMEIRAECEELRPGTGGTPEFNTPRPEPEAADNV